MIPLDAQLPDHGTPTRAPFKYSGNMIILALLKVSKTLWNPLYCHIVGRTKAERHVRARLNEVLWELRKFAHILNSTATRIGDCRFSLS